VKYVVYESQEEAIENIKAGNQYDVVVMESRFVPLLAGENLLAHLHKENLPNLRNISANFRELAYDPTNQYSVPYNWGTTGLVVRTDLVEKPVERWSDLWNPHYAGRVALWMGERREVIGIALKSLGYSVNSENTKQLERALQLLVQLKPHASALEDYDLDNAAEAMTSGKIVIAMGYAEDIVNAREHLDSIAYILPEEGALIWNDTFIIPANSPNQTTAELFLNFLLRADINAMIANENLYATPNEAALPLIKPEVLNNPFIFPPARALVKAELILPLSPEGQELYDSIWEQFLLSP
jgi:spermidine/putrescine transport system substrate-binding protein